jgi:hypothetical protein
VSSTTKKTSTTSQVASISYKVSTTVSALVNKSSTSVLSTLTSSITLIDDATSSAYSFTTASTINPTLSVCPAGYYPSANNCAKCRAGTFKPAPGNSTCSNCPENSNCSVAGSSAPACTSGFVLDSSNSCVSSEFTGGSSTLSLVPIISGVVALLALIAVVAGLLYRRSQRNGVKKDSTVYEASTAEHSMFTIQSYRGSISSENPTILVPGYFSIECWFQLMLVCSGYGAAW